MKTSQSNLFFRKVKNENGKEILDKNQMPVIAEITYAEILDIIYKHYVTSEHLTLFNPDYSDSKTLK